MLQEVEVLTDAERLEQTMGKLIGTSRYMTKWKFRKFTHSALLNRTSIIKEMHESHIYSSIFPRLHSISILRYKCPLSLFTVECGECSLAYPSNDTNFDKINLQVKKFINILVTSDKVIFTLNNDVLNPIVSGLLRLELRRRKRCIDPGKSKYWRCGMGRQVFRF